MIEEEKEGVVCYMDKVFGLLLGFVMLLEKF